MPTWWMCPLGVHQASSILRRLYRQDPASRMPRCQTPRFFRKSVKSKPITLTPDLVAIQSLSLVWSMIRSSASSPWQDCWAPPQVCFSSSPDINLVIKIVLDLYDIILFTYNKKEIHCSLSSLRDILSPFRNNLTSIKKFYIKFWLGY